MTTEEFAAWLKRHFPGHGGIKRAAEYLGRHRRTVELLRDGKHPVTGPTVKRCRLLDAEVEESAE